MLARVLFRNRITSRFGNLYCRGFASIREIAIKEDEVLDLLRRVKPGGNRDVVSMGIIKSLKVDPDLGTVAFGIVSADIATREACERILRKELLWLKQEPVVRVLAPPSSTSSNTSRVANGKGLDDVGKIVAVSSCKGGVGKSTVAVNLACALGENFRVGILDTDVYGPSLPTMVVPSSEEWAVSQSSDKKMIKPLQLHGMKCMSYGFVAPGTGGKRKTNEAAMLRGPMVSNIITQLAHMTDWGELDYLVLDLPPGTGDIHLTLGQQVRIDGAVIVTTPQMLSFVDVMKGLQMFDKLKVPTIGVVENMSWFDGVDGKRYFPFGKGHKDRLVKQYGIANSISLPILQSTSECGDVGLPFFIKHTQSETANLYRNLAEGVHRELESAATETSSTCSVTFDPKQEVLVARFFTSEDAKEYHLKPIELRKRLRRVDEMLGKPVDELCSNVVPVKVQNMGNYAVSITWSDGHDASIYPFEDVKQVCQELSSSGSL